MSEEHVDRIDTPVAEPRKLDLRPCPFCGGTDLEPIRDSSGRFIMWIQCNGCETDGPQVAGFAVDSKMEELWNTRGGDRCVDGCWLKKAVKEFAESSEPNL